MGIALRVDTQRDLFVETIRGRVEYAELYDAMSRKERLVGNRTRWRCLSDLRGCELRLELRQVRLLAAASARVHAGRVAMVVDNDLNYAQARQFKGFRERYTGEDTVAVFREMDVADMWLRRATRPTTSTPQASMSDVAAPTEQPDR